jgi:hypothetical protein
MGSASTPFAKVEGAVPTDAYDDEGIHAYFDERDCLEFVEAFSPAMVVFDGVSLLGRHAAEVETELGDRGYTAEAGDVGPKYTALGIALTLDARDIVEGVGVFPPGYYGHLPGPEAIVDVFPEPVEQEPFGALYLAFVSPVDRRAIVRARSALRAIGMDMTLPEVRAWAATGGARYFRAGFRCDLKLWTRHLSGSPLRLEWRPADIAAR